MEYATTNTVARSRDVSPAKVRRLHQLARELGAERKALSVRTAHLRLSLMFAMCLFAAILTVVYWVTSQYWSGRAEAFATGLTASLLLYCGVGVVFLLARLARAKALADYVEETYRQVSGAVYTYRHAEDLE